MNDNALTHDRCSELLGDFARGRLEAAESARVEAHLAQCPECSAELQAVMALQVEDGPLTEIERARLRRGVGEGLGDIIAARPQPSPKRARLAAALGVAALVAVIGVAVVSVWTGQDDEPIGASLSEGGGDDRDQSGRNGVTSDSGEAAAGAGVPLPGPSYDKDAGKLSPDKLRRIGEKSKTLTSFANAYSADDAVRLKDEYVSVLAAQASPPLRELIRVCANRVYEGQSHPALAAYAARGRLQGREALVLGFAWTDEDGGPLDQFMFWTWSQAGCDQTIDYRAGQISP